VPDARAPAAAALPLSVYPSLTPSQFKMRVRGAWVLAPNGDYPSDPPSTCFSDAPSAASPVQTLVNYSCIIIPNGQSPRNWWGRILIGGALDIGPLATQFKVCRYSGDYNGNGYTFVPAPVNEPETLDKIDNEEHPALYEGVTYSLARQNFLVIRGDASCPLSPVDVNAGYFVDASTYQLQP